MIFFFLLYPFFLGYLLQSRMVSNYEISHLFISSKLTRGNFARDFKPHKMNVGGLPNDYFNTSKFFISGNKKLKENGFKAPRHGRPLRKKSERRAVVVPKTILYLVLLGIFVLLCIILTLVHFGILQWKQYTTCLPNFTIGNCESMGFLDTYIWKEKKEYSVGMESCSYGVAFRTWAPLAAEVSVIVSNNSIGKTYQMRYAFYIMIYTFC